MFLSNKYTKIYHQIIEKAKTTQVIGYTEKHHIIPRSMGGSNRKDNLVRLPAREHFICHWLLTKMTTGKDKASMIYALNGMKRKNKFQERYETAITSKVYTKAKEEFSKVHSEKMKGTIPWNKGKTGLLTEYQHAKLMEGIKHREIDPENQRLGQLKRIAQVTGRKDSEETKKKKSMAALGKKRGPMSDEEKLKRSVTNKGKKKTATHAENVRQANIGMIAINKNNTEKRIKREQADYWIEQGWTLGGKKRDNK